MNAPKILVGEDDEPVAAMLCILLDVAGYRCVRTADAERGWTEARLGTLGAAVIDLRLPGRDGWWLIEKLRERAGMHRLPIVVVTGFLDEEVVRRAGELG